MKTPLFAVAKRIQQYLLLACGVVAMSIPAAASSLTWTLADVSFIGGGTVSGSFTGSFANSGSPFLVSSADLVFDPGSGYALEHFQFASPAWQETYSIFAVASDSGDLTGTPALVFFFNAPLTVAGTATVQTVYDGPCLDAVCSNISTYYHLGTTGYATSSSSSSAPEPATGTTLAVLALALGATSLRKSLFK